MRRTRIQQIWFGILGIAAGVAVMFSGVLTSKPAQASSQGITITIVRGAASAN